MLWNIFSITLKISCGTKMKCWRIQKHFAFQRMLLLMLLRLFWTRYLAKVWGVWHRHMQTLQCICYTWASKKHYNYDSNVIETKKETEPTLWKVGKQVFGSVQSECTWLVQCQLIYQQSWISQYQRLQIISLSGIHKSFPFCL